MKVEGNKIMVPKVFVSSTFYDLKYVRENIGDFVESYGFTPIISETGNIGYSPYRALDMSCYEAMRTSDMAILVIGGRYGSPSSDETMPEDIFQQYKSITRKEFEAAVDSNVPVYVFIEAPVYYEFETYKKNRCKIEEGSLQLQFASVDNINVFRFIAEVYSVSGVPIWAFTRVEDIKDKLKKQWATLLLRYLMLIKSDATQERLEDPINTINVAVKQMTIWLDKLGENLIDDEGKEEVRHKQLIERISTSITRSFDFCLLDKNQDIEDYLSFLVDKIYEALDNDILACGISNDANDLNLFNSHFNHEGVLLTSFNGDLLYDVDILNAVRNSRDDIIKRLQETDSLKKMHLN